MKKFAEMVWLWARILFLVSLGAANVLFASRLLNENESAWRIVYSLVDQLNENNSTVNEFARKLNECEKK